MKRPVIVWVEDDQADELYTEAWGAHHAGVNAPMPEGVTYDVPSDDQLTRAVEMAVECLEIEAAREQNVKRAEAVEGWADTLRAGFDLDEGGEP